MLGEVISIHLSDIPRITKPLGLCTYHVVFIPKYRRKVMYGELREDIRTIIRQLCEYKGVEIVSGSVGSDHIHLCLRIPPKLSISKGKSALMIFDKHPEYKNKGDGRHFWAPGYYVDTVGSNEEQILKYIQEQSTSLSVSLKNVDSNM